MKRGEGPKRKTPMRRTAMKRQPPTVALPRPRLKLSRDRLDPATRQAVYVRDKGLCALCGLRVAESRWQCHHRKLRARRGTDDLANLICLHDSCHAAVHGMPAWADAHGFMVPSWADPASWPVFRRRERWQQPTASGWVGSEQTDDQKGCAA